MSLTEEFQAIHRHVQSSRPRASHGARFGGRTARSVTVRSQAVKATSQREAGWQCAPVMGFGQNHRGGLPETRHPSLLMR